MMRNLRLAHVAPKLLALLQSVGLVGGTLVSVVMLLAIGTLFYNWPTQRSISVSANTEIANIYFNDISIWRFSNAILCFPTKRTRASVKTESKPLRETSACGVDQERLTGRFDIEWGRETKIRFAMQTKGDLELLVEQTDDNKSLVTTWGQTIFLQNKSRIVVSKKDFYTLGALEFSGSAVVGDVLGKGNNSILLKGSYEIREALPMRSAIETVRSGTFYPGDQVGFYEDDGDGDREKKNLRGFIHASESEERGFNINVFASSAHPSWWGGGLKMHLTRHGSNPTSLSSRWTDRALADSWAIGLTTILGFAALLVNLVAELSFLLQKNRKGK